MRNTHGIPGSTAAMLLAASLLTAAPHSAAKGSLVQQLQAAYRLTVINKDGKVTQAGSVLVVKKDGLQANPPKMGYYGNDYEDGQIAGGTMSIATDKMRDTLISHSPLKPPKRVTKHVDSRAVAVDEKVYLLRMDLNPASIDFYVQSCGDACKPDAPDPAHHPYLAEISFHFNKGYQNSDFSQVQPTISAVLTTSDDANASADQDAQAQSPQQEAPADPAPAPTPEPGPAQAQFGPIAPPEKPPAEAVQLGDTTDQVIAKLGQPSNTFKTDAKEIYIYKDFKVKITFEKGKVTAFE